MSDEVRLWPGFLNGVDRASFATAFAIQLRHHGVPVGLTGIEDFTRALVAIPPDSRSRLYWAARIALVRRQSELAAFDAVFEDVFAQAYRTSQPRREQGPGPRPEDTFLSVPKMARGATEGGGLPWATLPPAVSPSEDSDSSLGVPQRLPSELEGLADLPFEQLGEKEMELLGQWLQAALRDWPTRRSRRRESGPAGRDVALRQTIAASRRTGWEPLELVRVMPVRKPRKVVMLCDVSQSMQPQIAPYFHLMRGLAVAADGEAFAFATSLTRLTSVLRNKSTALAIDKATSKVSDRFGGTRIAASVNALLGSHHGNAVRGGIVVLGSDGWDSEPPQQLAAAMARLRRRANRVIWINPRVAAPGFVPLVGTMAAALPFCDELLAAHDFRSLAAVVTELGRSVG
ncbi:MAG: VWA domain-containing protein [Actinomycetota bacterium]